MSTHSSTFSEEGRFERNPNDEYITPVPLAKAVVEVISLGFEPATILDPGAGTGVWGLAAREKWPNATIWGVELKKSERPEEYDYWVDREDFLVWSPPSYVKFDLVIGNPPYSSSTNRNLAADFVMKSLELAYDYTEVWFVLKTEFLNGVGRYKSMYSGAAVPKSVYHLPNRPSWYNNGHTNTIDYSIFQWVKGDNPEFYEGSWLEWRGK